MRVEDSVSGCGRSARPHLLLAAAFVASCVWTCSGLPAATGDVVWDPVIGDIAVDNQTYTYVHDLDAYSPGSHSVIGSTFYLPWVRPTPTPRPPPLGPPPTTPTPPSTTTPLTTTAPASTDTTPSPPPHHDKHHGKHHGHGSHGGGGGNPVNRTATPDSILGYDSPCGVRNLDTANRIVGGTQADPGEFPWQVSLQKKRWISTQHICGGAIVSPFWVVTAGHCVDGIAIADLSIVAGEHNLYKIEGTEQRRNVVRKVGLGYDKDTFANDIVLLQLDRRLKFHPLHVAPICVPRPTHHYHDGEAVVSGWGRLSESGGLPNTLQYAALPLVPWPKCKKRYQARGFSRFLHTCQLCSGRDQGGQDSCQGDSGGPLACQEEDGRYYLCGVVSWGIGCARAEFPGVYTEVACYARWINEVLYNEHHLLDPEKDKPKA